MLALTIRTKYAATNIYMNGRLKWIIFYLFGHSCPLHSRIGPTILWEKMGNEGKISILILKWPYFIYTRKNTERSICMHKMDYIFDITGRNVEKSDSQVILFFCIFLWPPWSHFHYFSFWYACPITSWKLSYYKVSCKFIQMEFTIDEVHSNYFKIPTIRG